MNKKQRDRSGKTGGIPADVPEGLSAKPSEIPPNTPQRLSKESFVSPICSCCVHVQPNDSLFASMILIVWPSLITPENNLPIATGPAA